MARKAPYGTDEQPSWAVKIVGSKAFQVKARNGGRYDIGSLSRTPYKYSSRPPWFLDDDFADQLMSSKPNLKSISSLSPRNSQKQSSVISEYKETNTVTERKAVSQKNVSPDTEAINSMLSRLLAKYSSSNFKELYTDLAEYDSRLSGFIAEHQVETCLKRHRVPIPSTMLKMILPKFSSDDNADMINYESLIKYLFSFTEKGKESHIRKPFNSKGMKLGLGNETTSLYLESPSSEHPHVSPRSLVKKAMDDREEAYLLVQIEQAFKTNGPEIVNTLQKLHNDLRKLSNGTEYIKGEQIERTCSWLRVPLHHTLLGKILNRFDVKKNDKINWLEFVQFLEKAVPLSIQQSTSLTSQSSIDRSPLPFWEKQTPLGPLKSSPRKSTVEKEMRKLKDNYVEGSTNFSKERKKWDNSSKLDSLNSQSERSYEILKVENGGTANPTPSHRDVVERNDSSKFKPESSAAGSESKTDEEDKLERFSHLTEALLRSDTDSNGTLPVRDVFRIISNYNLVFNLNLPGKDVQEVIQSCKIANTNEVVIDNLAKKLWYLMK